MTYNLQIHLGHSFRRNRHICHCIADSCFLFSLFLRETCHRQFGLCENIMMWLVACRLNKIAATIAAAVGFQ